VQGLPGRLDEIPSGLVYVWQAKRGRRVPVIPVVVQREVDVDDVARIQWPAGSQADEDGDSLTCLGFHLG
jgi:hypothetical protein